MKTSDRWQAIWRTLRIIAPRVAVGVAFVLLALVGYSQSWTGFGAHTDPAGNFHPEKTLWDWIAVLAVPLVLGIGAFLFSLSERETEHAIASDRMQEETRQKYLDRMAELLLAEGLRTSAKSSEVREVARTRTLTVLRSLDHARKEILLDFLYESELIKTAEDADTAIISLRGADLTGVHLHGAYLSRANLSEADFTGADLTGAELHRVDLSGARLSSANLRQAKLIKTRLNWVNLSQANLREADLAGADLHGTDLRQADLRTRITAEQLAQARSLEGAIMPDGVKLEALA